MKRYAFLLCVFCSLFCLSHPSYSQHWVWQQPRPQGNFLSGIQFVNANVGWAVGNNGTILHTLDGGSNWIIQYSGTTKNLYSLSFPDRENGWAVGDTILHTTNGGATWVGGTNSTTIVSSVAVQFIDANHGWILSLDDSLSRTTDAGLTWQKHCVVNENLYEYNGSLCFVDSLNGWVGKDEGLFHTTDGGVSFSPSLTYYAGTAVSFIGNQGWVCCYNVAIKHTSNNGVNWTTQLTVSQFNQEILSICFTDTNHGWAYAYPDTIYRTTNGGASWIGQYVPFPLQLYGLNFIDNNTGWASGEGGIILRTTDGGITWNPQTDLPAPKMNDACFINANNGWVVGDKETFLHTTNNGMDWVMSTSGINKQFNSICALNQNLFWVVGDSGTVLHSTNGGTSWSPQTLNTRVALHRIAFSTPTNGCIVSDSGLVWHSTNGGASWTSHYLGLNAPVTDICWLDSTNGYIAGLPGLFHTTNGGASWLSQQTLRLTSVDFTDANHGWELDIQQIIYRTTNGGATWVSDTLDRSGSNLYNVRFADAQNGWVTGYNGFLTHTTNGGLSWTPEQITTNDLNGIAIADSGNVWIIGQHTILHSQIPEYGVLQGTVRNVTSNVPMRNITISTCGRTTQTDSLGRFSFVNLPTGTIFVSAQTFVSPSIDTSAMIRANDTTMLNLWMSAPRFHVAFNRQDTVLHPNDSIYGVYPQSTADVFRTIYLSNSGDAPLTWNLELGYGRTLPFLNTYDSVYSFNATQAVGGDRALIGIEFDGDNFWITGANNYQGNAKLYKVSKSGQLIRSINCPDTNSTYGWHGLAWDGRYLYSSYSRFIDKIDTATGIVVSRIQTGQDPVTSLTIDTANGTMYYCNAFSPIYKIRLSDGTQLDTFHIPAGVFGLGWNPTDSDSMPLYLVCRDTLQNTVGSRLYKINPTLHTRIRTQRLGNASESASGLTVSSRWDPELYTTISLLSGAGTDARVQMNLVAFKTNWITLEPTSGSLAPGGSDSVTVHLYPILLQPGHYPLSIRISSSTTRTDVLIPVMMEVTDATGVNQTRVIQPSRFALESNYPNPFNPVTTIRYSLDRTQRVSVVLYDVNGRETARLYEGFSLQGTHSIQFNGAKLASGVYFIRLKGERQNATKKITLLK